MNRDHTLKQVSKLLNNSRQAVYGLVKRERIKSIRKGRVIYISDSNLIEYCKLRVQELESEKKDLSELIGYLQ